MTPQEQQLLMQLTQRINQTQLQEKDPDAQNLLGRELGANSDALYIMAQTVLVQNMALERLKSQVAELQQQLQQAQHPAHATSFLGRLFGDNDQSQSAPAQTQPQPAPQYQQSPQQQGWQPVPNYQQAPPQYAQPQYGQPQYAQPQYPPPQYGAVPAGQPSFLRGAMQTAAGVAAGALVFEGVESLLHPWGHGGGFGWGGGPAFGGGFGGGFERPVEETVINNYYDQPGPGPTGPAEHHMSDSGANLNDQLDRDFGSQHPAHESAQFADANQNSGQFDQGSFDNSLDTDSVINDSSLDNVQIDDSGNSFDDTSSLDDSSSFDDGGGFDNSGSDGF